MGAQYTNEQAVDRTIEPPCGCKPMVAIYIRNWSCVPDCCSAFTFCTKFRTLLQSVVTVTVQVQVHIQNEIHLFNRLFLIYQILGQPEQEQKVTPNAGSTHATHTVINIYGNTVILIQHPNRDKESSDNECLTEQFKLRMTNSLQAYHTVSLKRN